MARWVTVVPEEGVVGAAWFWEVAGHRRATVVSTGASQQNCWQADSRVQGFTV